MSSASRVEVPGLQAPDAAPGHDNQAREAHRLAALDGLRGVAALVVFAGHLQNSFGPFPGLTRGYLMVDVFFMLSGFVLMLSFDRRLADGMGTPLFMAARVIRLWPMIACGVLIGAVVAGGQNFPHGFSLNGCKVLCELMLAGVLLVPFPWPHRSGALFPLNPPHWSLFWELIANLLHALVLWRLRDRTLGLLVVVAGLVLAWSIHAIGHSGGGPYHGDWRIGMPRVAFGYGVGMLMARQWQARPQWRTPLYWPLAVLLPALVTVALAYLPIDVWLGDAVAVLLVLPPLVWLAASCRPTAQASRGLSALGALSYPLYAIHLPIIRWAASISKSWMSLALVAMGCLALAAILAAVFERGAWPQRRRAFVDAIARRLGRPPLALRRSG